MNKFDWILLDSGSAGDTVRVQTQWLLDLTSWLYSWKNLFLNNWLVDQGNVSISNTWSATLGNGYPYNATIGTFSWFKSFSAVLNYNSGKTADPVREARSGTDHRFSWSLPSSHPEAVCILLFRKDHGYMLSAFCSPSLFLKHSASSGSPRSLPL